MKYECSMNNGFDLIFSLFAISKNNNNNNNIESLFIVI